MKSKHQNFMVPTLETDRPILRDPALQGFQDGAWMWDDGNVIRQISAKNYSLFFFAERTQISEEKSIR